jgi:amino acid transporter
MTTSGQLKKSALGTSGIVFFVVAAAAPLGATLGAGPVVFAANGVGAPGVYLLASVVLLLFAIGYATMSRYVTSAGGFTAYITLGLGDRAGHASAGVALLAYNCMLLGLLGQFGVFARDLLSRWGWDVEWQALAVAALVLTGALGYLEVTLSAKVLGVLMIAEVLILVVLDIVIIGNSTTTGLDAAGFDPVNMFSGAPGVALLFAFTCFVGFEATTIYGEEARDPRRTVPRATYVAVVLIGIFCTVTTWAIGQAYGPDVVMDRAAADPVTFVTAINTAVVGQFSTDLMQILVVTSVFAVMLAVHNTLTRYMFSLGRGGLLPEQLGQTHHRFQSPHRASVVQTVVTLVALGGFMIAGVDPFKQLFAWLIGLGTLGILVLQAAASLAVIAFFRRRAGSSLWRTLVAPLLGALGLLAGIVLAVLNFGTLTGITGAAASLLPLLIPVVALVAVVVASRRRHAVRLAATTTRQRS